MILYVDPNEETGASVEESLTLSGHDVASADSYAEATTLLEGTGTVTQLITDYQIGTATGLELAREVRAAHPDATCLLFTEASPDEIGTGRFEGLVVEYVDKGAVGAVDELLDIVEFESTQSSQVSYPRPENELERLAALEKYPTDSEPLMRSLDRMAELAKSHFDVEMAYVALLRDTAQDYIASCNVPYDQVPREVSACRYTVLEDATTVIEDIQRDPRFNYVDVWERVGIRFYAGVPLTTPEGRSIGTFCLLDGETRSFSESQERHLELFGEVAMDWFEQQRKLVENTAGLNIVD